MNGLDDVSIQKLQAHVHEKWPGGCVFCGTKKWQLLGFNMIPIQDTTVGFQFGKQAAPVVVVVCTNCGFTASISVVVIGAESPPEGQ